MNKQPEQNQPETHHARIHFSKPPAWVFNTVIFTLSFLFILFLVWHYTPVKDEVEARLIRQLQPYLGDSFYITDFSIGTDYLSFYNVRATDQVAGYSVEFAEIRLNYSPSRLLATDFDPLKTINNVTLIRPRVILFYRDEQTETNPDLSLEKVFEEILTNLKRFPEIDHIKIRDGSVILQMPWQTTLSEKQIPLFAGLKGRLDYLSGNEEVTVSLDGEFLGTENSGIQLTGYVDFAKKRWEASVNFLQSYFTSELPFWKIKFWQIDHARLNGTVQVINEQFDLDSLIFNGDVQVNDMQMAIFKQHAMVDSFNLRFEGKDLYIEPFECRIEDGVAQFSGVLKNILKPEVDWDLAVKDYSVKYLRQSNTIFEYANEGKMSAKAHFSGPLKQMDIHAEAQSPDILYAVIPFNTVRAKMDYNIREKILDLSYMRADFFEFRTQGRGEVNFNNDSLRLDLRSDIAVPEGYFNWMTGLNGGKVLVNTDFYGNFKTKLFRGGFAYKALGVDSLLVSGRGPFTLNDQLLRFNLLSDNPNDSFRLSGVIHDVFRGPNFDILEFKDFPMAELSYIPVVKSFLKDREIQLFFSGPYNSLASRAKIVEESNPFEEIASGVGHIRDIFMDNQRFSGRFRINSAPKKIAGSYDVAFSAAGMNLKVDAPDFLQVDIFQGSKPYSPYKGKIELAAVRLQDYLQNSPGWHKLFREGTVNGTMVLDGTVDKPAFQLALNADELVINGVGYYDLRVNGSLDQHHLKFVNNTLLLNTDTAATVDFHWQTDTDSLRSTIVGKRLESNFIAETILGDENFLRGEMSYRFDIGGTMTTPKVSGNLSLRNGILVDENPFTGISLSFTDSLIGENFWQLDNHILNIGEFSYHKANGYDIYATGALGITEYAPMDIEVKVDGNVFEELPRLMPYFINPKTTGKLYARIRGTRGNPLLDELDLQIDDGTIAFDGVVPPVSKLKVDVQKQAGNKFIKINTIEGLVDGRFAKIYNLESVVTKDGEILEPWYFQDIDINLGILALETAPNGIPLHFPGMMEEGDIGYFTAEGRLPGEAFYFAGPPDLPMCRGTTHLYNCRVTFPFIGMYDESGEYTYDENNRVIDFMMNMRWNLRVLPGNNNRYFVSIPGYVGEVFMDLNIDNTSEGLVFTGRLIDESFRVDGSVTSLRGRVEYLDVNFRVERFGAEFNVYEIYPEVYGVAYTTVRTEQFDPVFGITSSDSSAANIGGESVPRDILLKLYVIDPVTGKEVSKGRWEDFRFKLESRENPAGETQEQLLASLGYSFRNLQYKAGEVGLTLTQNFLIRPLFRPIERQLERKLKLDYVRLRSNFASNLLYMSLQDRTKIFNRPTFLLINTNLDPASQLLQSSELTLGKYLFKDIYMSYTGQLVAGVDDSKLGVNHTFGLEYRLLYNLLLEFEMSRLQYDPLYELNNNRDLTRDIRVRLRHSINF
jgi:hypothetical protein